MTISFSEELLHVFNQSVGWLTGGLYVSPSSSFIFESTWWI